MHELLAEATAEPTAFARPPVPEADYNNALQQLDEAWQSALQMIRFADHADEPSGRAEQSSTGTDGARLRGEASRALFVRFRQRASPVLAPVRTTLEHMLRAHDADIDSAIPQSLFDLYKAAQAFWQSLDDEWAGVMARFLHAHGGQGHAHGRGDGDAHEECFSDFLRMGSCLGQLRHLCEHTANMSWRMANIIQKQHPKTSFIPEPDDLYRFEVQV